MIAEVSSPSVSKGSRKLPSVNQVASEGGYSPWSVAAGDRYVSTSLRDPSSRHLPAAPTSRALVGMTQRWAARLPPSLLRSVLVVPVLVLGGPDLSGRRFFRPIADFDLDRRCRGVRSCGWQLDRSGCLVPVFVLLRPDTSGILRVRNRTCVRCHPDRRRATLYGCSYSDARRVVPMLVLCGPDFAWWRIQRR